MIVDGDEKSSNRKLGRPVNPMASRRLVRPDYYRKPKITYAEAAHMAGVAVATIEDWLCDGLIPRAARVGPYRIDREKLEQYLKTGVRVV